MRRRLFFGLPHTWKTKFPLPVLSFKVKLRRKATFPTSFSGCYSAFKISVCLAWVVNIFFGYLLVWIMKSKCVWNTVFLVSVTQEICWTLDWNHQVALTGLSQNIFRLDSWCFIGNCWFNKVETLYYDDIHSFDVTFFQLCKFDPIFHFSKKLSLVDCWSYQSFVAFNIVRWARKFFYLSYMGQRKL